jgi:hypothetical protein
MGEQRKSPRYPLALQTTVMAPKQRGLQLSAKLENMSASGVLMTVPAHFDIGDKIEYLITLPGDPKGGTSVKLHCMGRVVRYANEVPLPPSGEPIGATIEWYQFVREPRATAIAG